MKYLSRLFLLLSIITSVSFGVNAQSSQYFEKEDYQKALWMTTRFYGAQRSGHGPNWLIATHEPTNVSGGLQGNLGAFVKGKSFIKDADGDYDLTGGWFDCGDHVKFGQTLFYSAYMLILGYSEFPEGYDDYYSFDYNGYIGADDYSWEGKKGKPNGIPDILDEVKYATDYFMKCIRDKSTFYYQVGNGDNDHRHWVTSPVMSTLSVSEGGEAERSRDVFKASGNVTTMASLCGATLAAMSRLYKKYDPAYAQQCLDKALVAYEFVNSTTKGNTGGGGYYDAKGKYEPDMSVLFAELYRTTGESKYLTEAVNIANFMRNDSGWNHNYSLCYNNTEDLCYYVLAACGNTLAKERLGYYVNTLYKPSSGYLLNVKNGSWGVLRFPANQAFVYALYDKLTNATGINPYALATVEYIMGKNGKNFSYIVGFGNNHPKYPHHRNFFREDSDSENSVQPKTKFMQLGYMTGGSLNDGAYSDQISQYVNSEGGIDYNAGLVGALAYLNSKINPVDIDKFGHPTPDLGEDVSICGLSSIKLDSKVSADGKKLFTWYLNGNKLVSSASANTYNATKGGEYVCEIDSAGDWQTRGSVEIFAEIIVPEIDKSVVTLCNPATHTFDLSELDNLNYGLSYAWYKDGEPLLDSDKSSLKVYHAGKYSCMVSVKGCESKVIGDFVVDSKLPIVESKPGENGNISFMINSDDKFEWYAQSEGGTPLATGNTFTTKITENTVFYVQETGSENFIAGPKPSSFSVSGVDWGRIGANFTAKKPFSITGFTVKPFAIYDSNPISISMDLKKDGNIVGKYTSEIVENKGASVNYSFTFPTPIEIPEAGNYTLIPSSGINLSFYLSGPSYKTYASSYSDVLEFTGATNGDASKYPFPAIFDWQIEVGCGCERAPVLAQYVSTTADIETKEESEICLIYPNPFNDILYIDLSASDTAETESIRIEILSTSGALLKQIDLNIDNLRSGINLSELQKGTYILKVAGTDFVTVKSIFKR